MRELIQNILEKEIVTSQQAAEILGVHPSAVRQLVMKGKIPSVKKGFVRIFDVQDIRKLKR